jgi:predicted RNA binding protein YcfA (HicA-like mRNA interferase family)
VAKKHKRGPQLNRGPFTAGDVERALAADGWAEAAKKGAKHSKQLVHPEKPGKIPIKQGWTGLRAWDPILGGIARTSGLGKDRLLRLLNGLPPEP